jgi:8-oxo-dGTP pyrophosphatase MutT (NUDIX family)
MRWHVHGTRPAYQSPWVEVWLDDVELPDGERIEHHVLKFPRPSVGAVVVDQDRAHTLLIWRHRHITDAWGWEIPAGWADPGEDLTVAVAREIEEETGYRAATIEPMTTYHPLSGISTMRYTTFLARDAVRVSAPVDTAETTKVEWIALADVPKLAAAGQIPDGPSLTALSFYLGMHRQVDH